MPTDELGIPTPLNSLSKCCVLNSKLEARSVAKTSAQKQRTTKKNIVLIGINPNLFLPFKIEYSLIVFWSIFNVDFCLQCHRDPWGGVRREAKPARDQWECQSCKFFNSNSLYFCEVCGAGKPTLANTRF